MFKQIKNILSVFNSKTAVKPSNSHVRSLFNPGKTIKYAKNDELNNYVYLIQEREFHQSGECVYKIGKTKQTPNKRMMGYPKNTKVFIYFDISRNSCDDVEKKIMQEFDKKFINRDDIGREYYEGDLNDMKLLFMEILIKNEVDCNYIMPKKPVVKSWQWLRWLF